MSTSTTPPTWAEKSPEIATIGYVLAAGALLLLLPVLPVIAVLWILRRVVRGTRR